MSERAHWSSIFEKNSLPHLFTLVCFLFHSPIRAQNSNLSSDFIKTSHSVVELSFICEEKVCHTESEAHQDTIEKSFLAQEPYKCKRLAAPGSPNRCSHTHVCMHTLGTPKFRALRDALRKFNCPKIVQLKLRGDESKRALWALLTLQANR